MEYDFTQYHWDWEDIIKVLLSLGAGFFLGFEREWKDKAAGFKTISIICLGSTLFTILSYKMGLGESEDATRIASYVVSGIGFLGAGVIFKEGNSVSGLTTASIIWISAAIGMSIGFGQYITAGLFLLACFIIITAGSLLNYVIKTVSKNLVMKIDTLDIDAKTEVLQKVKYYSRSFKIKETRYLENQMVITLEILLTHSNLDALEKYLVNENRVREFRY